MERERKSRIVLIEDNPSDIYLMKLAFEEHGINFELTTFDCGADAVAKLCPPEGVEHDYPIPDLILLDLNTPRSDGFEVLGKLRSNPTLAGVPMAVVTSSAAPRDRHRAELLGGIAYIRKPTHLNAFLDTLGGSAKALLSRRESKDLRAGGGG